MTHTHAHIRSGITHDYTNMLNVRLGSLTSLDWLDWLGRGCAAKQNNEIDYARLFFSY